MHSTNSFSLSLCLYIYIYIYIYIQKSLSLQTKTPSIIKYLHYMKRLTIFISLSLSLYIYIYIYAQAACCGLPFYNHNDKSQLFNEFQYYGFSGFPDLETRLVRTGSVALDRPEIQEKLRFCIILVQNHVFFCFF